jgi:hypothetical protein
MRNFLMTSVPGLMTIAMVTGLGYLALLPPRSPASQPAAGESALHSAHCAVCRLPLYGNAAAPSKLGLDRDAVRSTAPTAR